MITPESMQAAREWYAQNALACIPAAVKYPPAGQPRITLPEGKFYVNDLPRYIANEQKRHVDALAGKFDQTFTFLQRAHYIQTGTMVPLLP